MGKTQITITVDAITVWAEKLSGLSVKRIAERHGVTTRSIYNWLNEAKRLIEQTPDLETMRRGLFTLYPEAVHAIKETLKNGKDKGQIGLRLLQGLAVLTEKKEIDLNDTRQLTSEQLRREALEIIAPTGEQVERDNPGTPPS
jgi:transposase-like protein